MTFLAPWWLAGSALLAASVVALHLLARRRPRDFILPTARFVPDRPATAAAMATRPTDLLLLLLRVSLILLLGGAFAQPVASPERRTTHIVLLDRSRLAPAIDSVTARVIRTANAIVAFDTMAGVIEPGPDSLDLATSGAPGSISAALVAALRIAAGLAGRGDSLRLTIISPFAAEEFDEATQTIREQWKGGITLVPVSAREPAIQLNQIVLDPDDPLAATLALLDPDARSSVRLVRGRPTGADTAWARSGGTLVLWPREPALLDWSRGSADSIGGVAVGDHAVVAAFTRDYVPPEGVLEAVWADGGAAATMAPLEKGCVRNIAIPLPEAGDLVLRGSFLMLSRELLSPCAGWIRPGQVAPSRLDSLRGGPSLLPAVSLSGPSRKTPANPWLLLGSALLFAAEPLVRRRRNLR